MLSSCSDMREHERTNPRVNEAFAGRSFVRSKAAGDGVGRSVGRVSIYGSVMTNALLASSLT